MEKKNKKQCAANAIVGFSFEEQLTGNLPTLGRFWSQLKSQGQGQSRSVKVKTETVAKDNLSPTMLGQLVVSVILQSC